MASFSGTTQTCKTCEKTVYWVEHLTADSVVYHKACFKCHHCKGTLKLSYYSSLEGVSYCKPHFDQLFKMTGSLEKSFEGFPVIQVAVDRTPYHKSCFRCFHGGRLISPSNYLTLEHRHY